MGYMVLRFTKTFLPGLRSMAAYHSFPRLLSSATPTSSLVDLQRQKEAFLAALPSIVDPLITDFKYKDVNGIPDWINEIMNYNVTGGKLLRGLSTVMTYEAFEKPECLTDQTLRLSYVLGWCVEMMQAYSLILDDIMDGSVTRRGVPCWYRLPHVGLGALNDTAFLFTAMHHTLRSNFGHLPLYADITDIIHKTMLYTCAGQHLDYSIVHGKKDYSKFTIDYYNTLIKYKTGYIFHLSVNVGMLLANVRDGETTRKVEDICLKIGSLFQVQDDYIEVFELESVTGKKGTDIQEGKCSWLAVTALQRCNDTQRTLFENCYGSSDPTDVDKIKQLYRELSIPEIYRREEQMRFEEVTKLVNDLNCSERVADNFFNILNLIFKRSK